MPKTPEPPRSKLLVRFENLAQRALRPGTEEEGRTSAVMAMKMLDGKESNLTVIEKHALHALLLENARLRKQLVRRMQTADTGLGNTTSTTIHMGRTYSFRWG